MIRVGEFSKISLKQFLADGESIGLEAKDYNAIKIPERSTALSAGYDIRIPYKVTLKAHETTKVITGLRVRMDTDNVLLLYPRSSIGIKYGISFANTTPVIDADYYNAENEGHIMLFLTNNSCNDVTFEVDTKICQGIFLPFGVTYSDTATGERIGGFGSTSLT